MGKTSKPRRAAKGTTPLIEKLDNEHLSEILKTRECWPLHALALKILMRRCARMSSDDLNNFRNCIKTALSFANGDFYSALLNAQLAVHKLSKAPHIVG